MRYDLAESSSAAVTGSRPMRPSSSRTSWTAWATESLRVCSETTHEEP